MTPRERLLTVLKGEIPDRVPVAPDFSNMIPAKLTGKPFWELYLYNNPPIWEAYIDCAKYFNIDVLMDGYFPFQYPGEPLPDEGWEAFVVEQNENRIVTQLSRKENGCREWKPFVNVYPVDNPPTRNLPVHKIGLPETPEHFEPLEGVRTFDRGAEGLKRAKRLMGDQGLVGVSVISSLALPNEEMIYWYYDNPDKHEEMAAQRVALAESRFHKIMALDEKPDFLCVGGSGTLIFQTVDMFRKIALPAVKRVVELATAAGISTHIHSCGPATELIRIMAEETTLTVIDPLEVPPMGDCDLKALKRKYGKNLTLKGNLHTTNVMLRGSREDVIRASKQAIDDAAENGRFILSTGDQCGRDTPFENLQAMVETAKTYGRY